MLPSATFHHSPESLDHPPANQTVPSICYLHASMYQHCGESQLPYGLFRAAGGTRLDLVESVKPAGNTECDDAQQQNMEQTRFLIRLCCHKKIENISANMHVPFALLSLPHLDLLTGGLVPVCSSCSIWVCTWTDESEYRVPVIKKHLYCTVLYCEPTGSVRRLTVKWRLTGIWMSHGLFYMRDRA